MIGFHYEIEQSQKGFEYNDPLTTDAFATVLLNSKNQQNKPFLTIYTSEQIMEYISPPLVMPQPVYILNLVDPNRIDLSSPIIKCGCLKMITDEIIDKSSISVENGYVKVGKDGRIDKRCNAYKDALKRYIRKKKREQKAKRIQKQNSQPVFHEFINIEIPYLIVNKDGTIDPDSILVQIGVILLKKNNKINKNSVLVQKNIILLKDDGDIDKRCLLAKRGLITFRDE